MKRITVWTEFDPKNIPDGVKAAYPKGMDTAIAEIFKGEKDFTVTTATLFSPDDGLPEELLAKTDVLIYWAHVYHDRVSDATVERIAMHVNLGMGVIFLHSAHHSKIIKRLLGTTCDLTWREVGEYERVWTVNPSHPIAAGVPEHFVIEHEEMYGEPFYIPEPDTTVFMGWFEGGEVFRSGVLYDRGYGKVFYFQPGHETFPVYYQSEVRRIILNAAKYLCPATRRVREGSGCPNRKEFLAK